MKNNLFNFSILDYVAENKMNIFNNSPFSDIDWFLNNKEDSNFILEPYEDPNQGIAFKDVNNIMQVAIKLMEKKIFAELSSQ